MKNRDFANKLQAVIDGDPELTDSGLALKAGLNNSTIRGLLSGRVISPNLDTAMKICHALNTTIEEFMGNPQTKEERDIARLVSQLSVEMRRQMIGYGEGLRTKSDRSHPSVDEEEQ